MMVFLLSLLIVGLVIAGMAIGVLLGRPPIKGSCGGIGALGIDTACEICGGDPQRCDEETRDEDPKKTDQKLYYPAGK
jgi:hypothetical protein